MGKEFASDSALENVKVYAVTRLIHDYTPSHYIEPDSKYTEEELCTQCCEDLKDESLFFQEDLQVNQNLVSN